MDMVARSANRSSDRHEARVSDGTRIQTRDPQPYDQLQLLPIAGDWRRGQAEHRLIDRNPYSDDILLEIKQADRRDLDTAFAAAAKAQVKWAGSAPAARAQVFRRAADVMEARR